MKLHVRYLDASGNLIGLICDDLDMSAGMLIMMIDGDCKIVKHFEYVRIKPITAVTAALMEDQHE